MSLTFEWDPAKAANNLKKHRVSFAEASTVFEDDFSITVADLDHSPDEERYLIIGTSSRGKLLIVSFAERSDRLRIISARTMTGKERRQYEETEDRQA
jgi:uncharacterized DUF497 family protein